MAAPPIPPIRLGLISTGLAVEKLHWPALRSPIGTWSPRSPTPPPSRAGVSPTTAGSVRPGAAAFLALAVGHPDRTFVVGENFFYRAELVNFADAVRFGLRPVGSVARSVANAMVVQRALDSAARATELALDRAARTTRQQFGVFRRMNDPQRGARLAVPAVATSPRR